MVLKFGWGHNMNNNFGHTVFAVLCAFVIFGMFAHAVNTAFGLPDVHFDYATNECVKVDNYGETEYTCDNLPKRFYHVWVIDGEVSEKRHQAGAY